MTVKTPYDDAPGARAGPRPSVAPLASADGSALLADVAQTNLALYRQLHGLRFTHDELIYLRDAYDLAAELFADRFRPSGKHSLAHLIGTACLLGRIGAPPVIVAAGLVHSAYAGGRFPRRAGPTRANRRLVRDVIGPPAEELVQGWHAMPWGDALIGAILREPCGLSEQEETLVIMRLCAELEDERDLGARRAREGHELAGFSQALRLQLARHIGFENLAAALATAYAEAAVGGWADPLHAPSARVVRRRPVLPRLAAALRRRASPRR